MVQKNKIEIQNLNFYYGSLHALKKINLAIQENMITAFIGPSGCGKSTFLRTLNRMNDLIPKIRVEGKVFIDGDDIYSSKQDVSILRRKVGMVFQKPNPFPSSVFNNIAYGLRIAGIKDKDFIQSVVKESLEQAALLDEVEDRLNKSALEFSGGQQQRICIARALAIKPEILLMDEPTSSLDPISTAKIEELLPELKKHYTIIIVTHNMQQAARVSDYTGFFLNGELIEFDETKKMFTNPSLKVTEDYITGRFG